MNIGMISKDRNLFGITEENIFKVFHQYIFQKYRSFSDFYNYTKSFQLDCLIVDTDVNHWLDSTQKIKNQVQNLKIIFIGSHLEDSYKTYDIDHIGFVYKDDLNYLKQYLDIVKNEDENQYCTFNWKDKTFIINTKEIIYFERNLRKTIIHMKNEEKHETYKHINDFENECINFKRIHNKYLVNPEYINRYVRDIVILQNEIHLPISRPYQGQKLY